MSIVPEVDADHVPPELEVQRVPGGRLERGRVVDQDVDLSEVGFDAGACFFDACRVTDVERES
jgi:hypothetical protein